MKLFRRKLRRLWIQFIQSRYLVPIAAVLFVVVFLVSAGVLYQNARAVRNRLKHDFSQQTLQIAEQAANRIDWALELVQAELMVLQAHDTMSSELTYMDAMRSAYARSHRFGTTDIGRVDANAYPFQIYEIGKENYPEQASVNSLNDIGQLIEVSNDDGTSNTWLVIGAGPPSNRTDTRILYYARIDMNQLLESMFSQLDPGQGSFYFVDSHGHITPIGRRAESESRSYQDQIQYIQSIDDTLERQFNRDRSGHGEVILQDDRAAGPVIASYVPLDEKDYLRKPLGGIVLFAAATDLLNELDRFYNRQYLLLGGLLVIIALFGLMIASYQQRTSRRLKHLVGEQDQIIASILTNSVDGVIVFDNEENIQMWNRGAQLIFGYTPEEMLGQSFRKLIPHDIDPDREISQMNQLVAEKGYVRNYVTTRMTKDGRRITVDISRTPFKSADGQFEGHTAVIKDVTEKVEFDQKMYNAEKLASIGLLASGVAHEINNPLTIILGFTDLLKERFDPDSEVHADLDKIEANANQAKKIVEDLLGFSRSHESQKTTARVDESIDKLVEFISQTRIAKKIDLELELEKELPPVNGDPRELQQVLLNLINNSVAAMENREGKIHISARQIEDGNWIQIKVSDTGKGIPKDVQARVFDPFFTTKEFGEGTGLGLSLCYGLVKKWGGTIEFKSQSCDEFPKDECGTTFTLNIPVYDVEFNPEAVT